ncbi:MAG: DNA-protecting protein DprA, partial [Bacteroides sp.]|nr:DNA-protecting protein DprA [Bacteroides sp.]
MTDARADILARIRAAFPSIDARAAAAEADFVARHGIDIYSRAEGTLPARLAACPDAPSAIFGMGRCRLDGPRNVAVVGT